MNEKREEVLLKALLRETKGPLRGGENHHLDDETLALFAAGALEGEGRTSAIAHLADCDHCRQVAALLMAEESAEVKAVPSSPAQWSQRLRPLLALAASVLAIALGWWLLASRDVGPSAEQRTYDQAVALLEAGQFAEAREVLAKGQAAGVRSDRLLSLESQAVREMPGPVALAMVGRLSDFGYEIGGVAARGPKPDTRLRGAQQLLAEAGGSDLETRLNRGHLLLSLGEAGEARKEFEAAVKLGPENALSWLGTGLAAYLEKDYPAALAAFRRCLELQPRSIPARIDLAMTLEELDRWDEAKQAWSDLLTEPTLPAVERKQIEQVLRDMPK